MRPNIKTRISTVTFFQYFALGSIVPIMTVYLKEYLGFSGSQAGWVLSMTAFSSVTAPLLSSLVAEKSISTERLYTFLHIVAAGLIFALFFQTTFLPVLILWLCYMLLMQPTSSLLNGITFHHVANPKRSFGGIRMWGTIGWIAAAWFFGYFYVKGGEGRLSHALLVAAGTGVLLCALSLFIPVSREEERKRTTFIPKESLAVLRQKGPLLLLITGFLVSVCDRYYYFAAAPFLYQIGFPESGLMPAMSLGQMSEVAGMALLGVLLTRWNFKKVFALGIIFSAVRFIGLLIGGSKYIALVGIFFHGLNFALFYGGAFVYLDGLSERKAKTGVQQLFLLATMGLANLAGNSSAGWIMDLLTSPETGEVFYRRFWMFPLLLCGVAFILIVAFFRDSAQDGQEALSPP